MPVCRRAGLRGRGNANYRGENVKDLRLYYLDLAGFGRLPVRRGQEEDACFADEHPALQTVIPCYNQQLATLPLSFSLKAWRAANTRKFVIIG